MNIGLKIGELASRTGCSVETVRYYEREKLLPAPGRTEGNYRLYDEEHVARLSFIRRCRSLDMTLDEIRTLLRFRDSPDEICQGVNELLDTHIDLVTMRIAELQRLEEQLRNLRGQCGELRQSRDCGILNELSHAPLTQDSLNNLKHKDRAVDHGA